MVGEINKKLKAKIVEYYGSQRGFASETRIPEDLVSRVLRGRYNLTGYEQDTWAKALHTEPERIFQNAN